MSDGFFFTLAGLCAAAMILVALVWPQGLGLASPVPALVREWIQGPPANDEVQLKGPV